MSRLFKFAKKQKVFEVAGVKLGGQPGQLPTVLIGSIFHKGHKIVKDPIKGVFDRRRAEHLINLQDEYSDKTGNPCMVDVVGETVEALDRYIDFVASITDSPILVNGVESSVRVEASRHAVEVGLKDRVVYNSLNFRCTQEELQVIGELGLEVAIVQSFNPHDPTPRGMLKILAGLLEKVEKYGVSKPLVLTPVLDIPSIGLAATGLKLIKENLGLPTGCPPVGVVGRWKRKSEYSPSAIDSCRGATLALVQTMGADFIIYGSLSKAPRIFPACAFIDAIIAYHARFQGVRPLTRNHPLYRIF
ncbi:tetrahydromethanopterin S-methyltransferase subunit H [Candidatus Bathyarchaeota archaeon]|nr:tetrahydromethanopterin S-methyltransferase subunit H [Candidatus Bathyarchaeota archaeon]